jgi:hypothetical protein
MKSDVHQTSDFLLPEQLERRYPRLVKTRSKRYTEKIKKNTYQLLTDRY